MMQTKLEGRWPLQHGKRESTAARPVVWRTTAPLPDRKREPIRRDKPNERFSNKIQGISRCGETMLEGSRVTNLDLHHRWHRPLEESLDGEGAPAGARWVFRRDQWRDCTEFLSRELSGRQ